MADLPFLQLTKPEIDLRRVDDIPANAIIQIDLKCPHAGFPERSKISISILGIEPDHCFNPLLTFVHALSTPPSAHNDCALDQVRQKF